MVQRLISETIRVQMLVSGPPAQSRSAALHVLVNLAVNVSDAMLEWDPGHRDRNGDGRSIAAPQLLEPGRYAVERLRHGRRHGRGDQAADLRAVLHDEEVGKAPPGLATVRIVNQLGGSIFARAVMAHAVRSYFPEARVCPKSRPSGRPSKCCPPQTVFVVGTNRCGH
jgi:hypothetical protein